MENTDNKNNKMVWVVPAVLVILAVGYFVFGYNKTASPVDNKVSGQTAITVNGTIISKATYDAQLASSIASYKTQGVDVTDPAKLAQIKTQVLDDLVSNELLNQGVKSAGIKTDPAEVEKQFQAILTQTGGADKLQAELVKNNLTEAQLRENISKQLAEQTYLSQNIDMKSVTASDAEIAQFYADYSKAQKTAGQTTVPALKDLSAQIKQQIISNKQQVLVTSFIATLRAKAKIESNI